MSEGVARYYDRNTSRFLFVGGGSDTHSMHRELWGPGVQSARDAARYVDRLVADEVEAISAGTVVDFGCGVGGSLIHLAQRFPEARLAGVTISARQVEIADRLLEEAGIQGRCSVVRGDFHSAQLGVSADVVFAIESLAHSDDLDAFVSNASRHLGAGGVLVIVDDFLAAEPGSLEPRQLRRIDQLRSGWRVPGLCTVDALVERAASHRLSLRRDTDLSGYTRPGSRVRDRLIALCSPIFARLGLVSVPFFGNMIGGDALQIGLREGFIRYRLLVFDQVVESEAT